MPRLVITAAAGHGTEDVILAVTVAASDGSDDTARTLSVLVAGLPAGARVSAGTYDPEGGRWVLRSDELDRVAIVPPPDFAGDIDLHVTAIALDDRGGLVSTAQELSLQFAAVADGARISAAPAGATEDRAIPLNLGIAAADADGSEEVTAIILSGLPAGAGIAPAAGITRNGDGTWSVSPSAAGSVQLLPPEQAHGNFSVTVAVTTREASNGATATVARAITVVVVPSADAPAVSAADALGHEDQAIPLALSAALADRDGSEALSIVLSGFPNGARLSAGINNGDGTWTLTPSQLPGLSVTPPRDWSGSMALVMRAHAMERSTGEVATTLVEFRVSVAGHADAPLVDAAATTRGAEDSAIPIDIVANLADRDGSETLLLHVSGVPAGGAFSAGAANPDGSWTIPGTALGGLCFTPPPNFAGTLRLDLAATSVEADGDSAAARFSVAVTVDPVADAPSVALAAVTGNEDTRLPLPLAAALADTDGSESIARFLVGGLPPGASLSAGVQAGGVWTLTAEQAATVALVPAAHWSGSATLHVTAIARESANGSEAAGTAVLPVTILPVADAPILTAPTASGAEDSSVALNLAAALADTDGSERLAEITLSGLPDGFALSAGVPHGGGVWELQAAQLPGLRLLPPADWNGSLSLTLAATAQDSAGTARSARSFAVNVQAVNDAPVLTLLPAPDAAVGQSRGAAARDSSIVDVDSSSMGGATITLAGGGDGDRLVVDGFVIRSVGGATLVGDTGIALTRQPGGITLAGLAPRETYAEVLGALAIENDAGLAAGTRRVAVTLRDEQGAAGQTRTVELAVEPSVVSGTGDARVLTGSSGHDTFLGSVGDETMLGGNGSDLFVVSAGSWDRIDGGGGTDTVRIMAAGGPRDGGWTLVTEAGAAPVEYSNSFDFAAPVSGHISFADGTQLELLQIERITW